MFVFRKVNIKHTHSSSFILIVENKITRGGQNERERKTYEYKENKRRKDNVKKNDGYF
jgi:hypothetical protein